MRVVIIGGSGHVGTYLVPRLVAAGYEVIAVSRGQRDPYQPHAAWRSVTHVTLDREREEAAGVFGQRVRELTPDIVIDMICFTLASAQQLVEALQGQVQHLLHCGTIWVHGPSAVVPTTEEQPRRPFGDYGIQKAAIEAYLLEMARRSAFPVTILHPGHIVGRGWAPLNPAGHFNGPMNVQIINNRIDRGGCSRQPHLDLLQKVDPVGNRPSGIGPSERLASGRAKRTEDVALAAPSIVRLLYCTTHRCGMRRDFRCWSLCYGFRLAVLLCKREEPARRAVRHEPDHAISPTVVPHQQPSHAQLGQ